MFSFLFSFFTIPENGLNDILANVKGIFSDMSPLTFLIVGVLLTFLILESIIPLLTGRKIKNEDEDEDDEF